MKTSPAFAEHCLDLFSGLGPVAARAMFGGYGFYVGPAMFAIGDAEDWKVWLKTDDETRARFEAAGGVAFTYVSKGGRSTTMSFVSPPDDALEEADAMLPWAKLALEAAERAVAKRRSRGARAASGPEKVKGAGAAKAHPKEAGKSKRRR